MHLKIVGVKKRLIFLIPMTKTKKLQGKLHETMQIVLCFGCNNISISQDDSSYDADMDI